MKMSKMLNRNMKEIPVGPDWTRPLPHTSVGIEVEVEGVTDYDRLDWKRWKIEREGSLVNGIEFVSEPVWGTAITDTLGELDGFFKQTPPYISFRGSIHVHINILDMLHSQLAHFIKLYLVYEPALFRLHEKWNRSENIFCVPAYRSVQIQKAYASLLRDIEMGGIVTYLRSKYAAMNTNSLSHFGTLEFRHMGGTADMDSIDQWINILLQLKAAALLEEPVLSPKDVWWDYLPQLDIRPEDLEKGALLVDYVENWR